MITDIDNKTQRFEIETKSPMAEVTMTFEEFEEAVTETYRYEIWIHKIIGNQRVEKIRVYTEDGKAAVLVRKDEKDE